MPNKNRTTINEKRPVAKPVNAVNNDHHKTIRIKTAVAQYDLPTYPMEFQTMHRLMQMMQAPIRIAHC